MTPDELDAIRERDVDCVPAGYTSAQAARDRRALLAEVDRLTDLLTDEGYRDGIRLAEAVNEVVAHDRGNIEAAWRYGDEQRAIIQTQQKKLLTTLAEIDRLTATPYPKNDIKTKHTRILMAVLAVLDKVAVRSGQEYVTVKVAPVIAAIEGETT